MAYFSHRIVADTGFRKVIGRVGASNFSLLVLASSLACLKDGPCTGWEFEAITRSTGLGGVIFCCTAAYYISLKTMLLWSYSMTLCSIFHTYFFFGVCRRSTDQYLVFSAGLRILLPKAQLNRLMELPCSAKNNYSCRVVAVKKRLRKSRFQVVARLFPLLWRCGSGGT